MKTEDEKIRELFSYSRLQWEIATKNNVHPSELTIKFLKEITGSFSSCTGATHEYT